MMPAMLVDPEPYVRPRRTDDPFENLFAREYPRVVAIARRVVGELHAAEDVAQDVFVSFHRGRDPQSPFAAAWLHSAAVHRALNHLRGARRRRAREASRFALDLRDRADVSLEADPQRAAVRQEDRQEVRAALGRLSEKSSSVLALRYAGLSYAEVAAALGVKVNQVGTLLARAECAFKKEIARASSR
jgi:RNA polymerase sigma factor (sigma-70 family)